MSTPDQKRVQQTVDQLIDERDEAQDERDELIVANNILAEEARMTRLALTSAHECIKNMAHAVEGHKGIALGELLVARATNTDPEETHTLDRVMTRIHRAAISVKEVQESYEHLIGGDESC